MSLDKNLGGRVGLRNISRGLKTFLENCHFWPKKSKFSLKKNIFGAFHKTFTGGRGYFNLNPPTTEP